MEIIADVLGAALKNGKKTRIMYYANLSHVLLEKYLREAVEIGFVSFVDTSYRLTEKGEEFLGKYNSFSTKHMDADKMLNSLVAEREELERMCQNRNGRNCVKPSGRKEN